MESLSHTVLQTLVHIWDLITSDILTLSITGVLAITLLGMLAFASWPSRTDRAARTPRTPLRSAQARALVALGTSDTDVARRTGLARDALALMGAAQAREAAATAARQKGPKSARLAFRWPSRRPRPAGQNSGQVMV